MKASELRIGNYIYVPQRKSVEQIGGIEQNGRFILKNYVSSFSGIFCAEPIPLTEEWLLKFGFEKWNDYCYCNNKLAIEGITSSFDKSICLFRCGNDDYVELTNIKYVHSLQNIHFDITGEELTLKEI